VLPGENQVEMGSAVHPLIVDWTGMPDACKINLSGYNSSDKADPDKGHHVSAFQHRVSLFPIMFALFPHLIHLFGYRHQTKI
jgi:hypothetical protein